MKIRSAIEVGLVGLGLAGGGLTAYQISIDHQALLDLYKSNNELRQELTNEEVERCLTDNIDKLIIRNVGGPNFPDANCSTEYAPHYTPDTAPGQERQQITPGPDIHIN